MRMRVVTVVTMRVRAVVAGHSSTGWHSTACACPSLSAFTLTFAFAFAPLHPHITSLHSAPMLLPLHLCILALTFTTSLLPPSTLTLSDLDLDQGLHKLSCPLLPLP